MTSELTAIFKKSLKSNRWNKIDLGPAENYTHDNMVARWVIEKNKWLHVSHNLMSLINIYFRNNRPGRRMCAVVLPAVPFLKVRQSLHGSPSDELWNNCRDPTTPSNSITRWRTLSNSTMKYGMNLLPLMSERKRKSVYKGLTKWSKKEERRHIC